MSTSLFAQLYVFDLENMIGKTFSENHKFLESKGFLPIEKRLKENGFVLSYMASDKTHSEFIALYYPTFTDGCETILVTGDESVMSEDEAYCKNNGETILEHPGEYVNGVWEVVNAYKLHGFLFYFTHTYNEEKTSFTRSAKIISYK